MFSFLKKLFYNRRNGFPLGDGWFVKGFGPDNMTIIHGEREYDIYAPKLSKGKRTVFLKDAPDTWLKPIGELISENEKRMIFEKAKKAFEAGGEKFEFLNESIRDYQSGKPK
jgi:hypothetical protein